MTDLLLCLGVALIVGGIAWIYRPAGLIVLGVFALLAGVVRLRRVR